MRTAIQPYSHLLQAMLVSWRSLRLKLRSGGESIPNFLSFLFVFSCAERILEFIAVGKLKGSVQGKILLLVSAVIQHCHHSHTFTPIAVADCL